MALQNMSLSTTLESLTKDLTSFFFRRDCNSGTEDIGNESEFVSLPKEAECGSNCFFTCVFMYFIIAASSYPLMSPFLGDKHNGEQLRDLCCVNSVLKAAAKNGNVLTVSLLKVEQALQNSGRTHVNHRS